MSYVYINSHLGAWFPIQYLTALMLLNRTGWSNKLRHTEGLGEQFRCWTDVLVIGRYLFCSFHTEYGSTCTSVMYICTMTCSEYHDLLPHSGRVLSRGLSHWDCQLSHIQWGGIDDQKLIISIKGEVDTTYKGGYHFTFSTKLKTTSKIRALRACHTPCTHCAICRSTFVCMVIILWFYVEILFSPSDVSHNKELCTRVDN